MSMNDGGFVLEVASFLILVMVGVILVSIGYGFFKATSWLYKKTRKHVIEAQVNKNETET